MTQGSHIGKPPGLDTVPEDKDGFITMMKSGKPVNRIGSPRCLDKINIISDDDVNVPVQSQATPTWVALARQAHSRTVSLPAFRR